MLSVSRTTFRGRSTFTLTSSSYMSSSTPHEYRGISSISGELPDKGQKGNNIVEAKTITENAIVKIFQLVTVIVLHEIIHKSDITTTHINTTLFPLPAYYLERNLACHIK